MKARGQSLGGAFRRMAPGKWFSRRTVKLQLSDRTCWILPGRMFNRGTMHDGIDLAALLDEAHATGQLPPRSPGWRRGRA